MVEAVGIPAPLTETTFSRLHEAAAAGGLGWSSQEPGREEGCIIVAYGRARSAHKDSDLLTKCACRGLQTSTLQGSRVTIEGRGLDTSGRLLHADGHLRQISV